MSFRSICNYSTKSSGCKVMWTSDFLGYGDPVQEEERKSKFLRFLKYAVNENPGVVALWLSIAGANHFAALEVFCGIRSNLTTEQKTRNRKDCVNFDVDKFQRIIRDKGIMHQDVAEALGCSVQSIRNILYRHEQRKGRKFVRNLEKFLGMPEGSLEVKQ